MNSKHQCSMDNIKTWESLEQLFEAMNESLDYLVLRNTEDITKEFSPSIHGDIDILVRDLKTAIQLMQAIKYHKEPYRVYYEVKVADGIVPFDIRYVGDNYYCEKWENDVLNHRVFVENRGMKYYMMSPEQQYYTLLYHVYLQKKSVSLDYPDKLTEYAKLADERYINEVSVVMSQLVKFMNEHQYTYVLPNDLEVCINRSNMRHLPNYQCIKIEEKLNSSRILFRIKRLSHKIICKIKKILHIK